MNELKQLTVYVAADKRIPLNEIRERLLEKLLSELMDRDFVKLTAEFGDYKVYDLSVWVPENDQI